jgi:hypothetical protein
MPYEVNAVAGNGFQVINSETKEVKATKDTKEDADRLVRILNEVEKNPNWETEKVNADG